MEGGREGGREREGGRGRGREGERGNRYGICYDDCKVFSEYIHVYVLNLKVGVCLSTFENVNRFCLLAAFQT